MNDDPDFDIKENDTSPAIRSTLIDSVGDAEVLTGADVRFKMVRSFDRVLVVDEPAEVVDASAGEVRYAWSAEDTAETGNFLVEWEVTWAPGTDAEQIATFPNHDHIEVYIYDDNDE